VPATPASPVAPLKHPIAAYQLDGNNPEDDGFHRMSTTNPFDRPITWIEFRHVRDLRITLAAQRLLIVSISLLLLPMNGIIAGR
jgi:hypothetical protein